jgi:site-specific DNA recombinase
VFEGRRVSSVAVDEERAPYVLESFELFATDEYTEATLHELMVARGMTTPPTLKHPARPIALSTFGKMLRNRYYLGEVYYKGQWYKGRHPAIITPELFDRVQRVLDSHSGSGARSRKWNHYLKGVFGCARCGSRMIFQRAKGNGGTYYYFACSKKRVDHTCDQPYVLADVLDRELLRYFAGAHLADDLRERIAQVMDETLADEQEVHTRVRARLNARLKELDKQEDRYLDLLGDPDWPQEKIKAKVTAVQRERQKMAEELAKVEHSISAGRELLVRALELLKHPQELFRQSAPAERRVLTLAIYGKLKVDGQFIVGHELREPFDVLLSLQGQGQATEERGEDGQEAQGRAYRRAVALPVGWGGSGDLAALRAAQGDPGGTATVGEDASWADLSSAELLNLSFLDSGSLNGVMVGGEGFEPPASSV